MPASTNKDSRLLYRLASVFCGLIVLFIPVQGLVFWRWPPPQTVEAWFALFRQSPLIGLLDMDLLLTVDYLLFLFIYFALYLLLKKASPVLSRLFLLLQALSLSAYLASATAVEMLALSGKAAAASAEELWIYRAAGEAVMARWQGTAFTVSYLLGAWALLLLSAAMQRDARIPRWLVLTGFMAGALMLVPPTFGKLGFYLSFISLVPTLPWLAGLSFLLWRLPVKPESGFPTKKAEENLSSADRLADKSRPTRLPS